MDSPPPQRGRCSPPALPDDDAMFSIFLRIPPDDPARLVRASLACKAWRRVLADPQFCRLYREFHGTPPLLGLVVNTGDVVSARCRFIPTKSLRRLPSRDPFTSSWKAVDSRHGRILVEDMGTNYLASKGFIVWDPIANGQWGIPYPRMSRQRWTGAVLCAKQRCDHLGCHGPPFLVIFVGSVYKNEVATTSACVYSSESGVWSDMITVEHPDFIDNTVRSILVESTLYFPFDGSFSVLEYKLGAQKLSVINGPSLDSEQRQLQRHVLILVEDAVLVFAGIQGSKLYLWSTEVGPNGSSSWAGRRVIELEKLLPPIAFTPKPHSVIRHESGPNVSGFAQGVVFLSTMAGLFTVELNSGRTKKVAKAKMALQITPYTSFYSLGHAGGRILLPSHGSSIHQHEPAAVSQ